MGTGAHGRVDGRRATSPPGAGLPRDVMRAQRRLRALGSASTGARCPTCRSTRRSPTSRLLRRLLAFDLREPRHLAGARASTRATFGVLAGDAARAVALAADEAEGRPGVRDRRQPRRTLIRALACALAPRDCARGRGRRSLRRSRRRQARRWRMRTQCRGSPDGHRAAACACTPGLDGVPASRATPTRSARLPRRIR